MYEFLAPWGVLIPILSAAFVYFPVSERRRAHMIRAFEVAPSKE